MSRPSRTAGGTFAGSRAAAASALVALVLAGACTSAPQPTPTTTSVSSSPPASTTSATPSPSTPSYPGLTGGPVLAVKIDNTSPARPRIGIGKADVVYVELVEGGLTRLLAVFSSAMPPEVGPVRSARESDGELLGNYGKVAFAFSGATDLTMAAIHSGPQVNLSNDQSGQGFRREGRRAAPYNLIGNTETLLARAGGSVPPGDVGFRFGPAGAGGRAAKSVDTAYQAARVSFAWDPARRQYLLSTDGRPDMDAANGQVGAATVIVQTVKTHLSANRDVNGVATPVLSVIGTGPVTVLRDGLAWDGTWSRPDAARPTTFATAAGTPILLSGTPIWVLLVPEGQAVTVG